jgi:aminoglycoside 2'-N-acetyltransferase I
MAAPEIAIRQVATASLTGPETAAIRELLRGAFADDGEGFTGEDWAHALGGSHFVLEQDGAIVAHAAVVERELHAGTQRIRAGYVEAVATRPEAQRLGHGTRLMHDVDDHIRANYELGALSAASPAFYAMLGWEPWLGPTAVRTAAGEVRTPDDDGAVFVLLTPSSPALDRHAVLSCPWRSGDVW